MNEPLVYNIQKYSAHDGHGIHTTVYFKGCPMKCKWCENPEAQSYQREIIFDPEKCVDCGTCVAYCQNGAISNQNGIKLDDEKCTGCGICTEYCYQAARELIGKRYAIPELVSKLVKDAMFYEENNGGVRLSGGEVMTQDIQYIRELVRELHARGFYTEIHTSGCCAYESFKRLHPFVDTFIYEIKIIDNEKHIRYTGVENTQILENLIRLSKAGVNLKLQMPLIEGINDTDDDILQMIHFLKKHEIAVKRLYLIQYSNRTRVKKISELFSKNGIHIMILQ